LLVLKEGGATEPFSEASAVFKSIDATIGDQFLEVYAPLHLEGQAKETAKQKIQHVVIQLLQEMEKDYGD